MKNNVIVIHDTEYSMNKSYREGALAFRRSIPWSCNPNRDGTQAYSDWDYGHVNESAGEHFRFSQDVISAPLTGTRFEMDEKVPRLKGGDVDPHWVVQQFKHIKQAAPSKLCAA